MIRVLALLVLLACCQCTRAPAPSPTSAIAWTSGEVHPGAGPVLSPLFAPGAQNAVAWLPDGTFWNGDFEIALFDDSGEPLRFGDRRFVAGGLPAVRATAQADGNVYEVTAFMPWRGSDQDSLGWALVSVTARPDSARASSKSSVLRLATRASGPRWHFLDARSASSDIFAYEVRGPELLRDDRLIAYVAGAAMKGEPDAGRKLQSRSYAGRMSGATGGKAVEWRIWIAPPGAVPQGQRPPDATRGTDELLAQTVRAWRKEMALGASYQVPDAPTQRVLDAAHAVLVGTRARSEGRLFFPGSPFQYRDYFLRDGARVLRALDLWGRHDLSKAAIVNLFEFQWPMGAILSQRGQLDGTGQALWALGQHADLGQDPETCAELLPKGLKATDWIRSQRRLTNLHPSPAAGLLPVSDPRDNENLRGHLLGTDAWALSGIEAVARLQGRMGQSNDSLRNEAARYRARLLEVSDVQAARQGRPLPPAVEQGAREWGNWSTVYPCGVLDASDARARALDRFARARYYVDGLPTVSGPDVLHAYLGFDLAQAALRRGERATVDQDLEAAVRHTQPDGHGLEVLTHRVPDYGEDLPPHTTFAAMFTDLVRSAIVYERGDSLVLLGGVPESWLEPGRTAIVATAAPTRLGPLYLEARSIDAGLELRVILPAPARVSVPGRGIVLEVRENNSGARALVIGPHDFTLPAGKGSWTVLLVDVPDVAPTP